MRLANLVKRIWPFLLVLLIAWGAIVMLRAYPKSRPLSAQQLEIAKQGVARNSDWQPVLRRVNGYDMALVPAGCFEMGSSDAQLIEAETSCDDFYGIYGCKISFDNEQPAHRVCISQPYWIDLTAVTNRQYGKSTFALDWYILPMPNRPGRWRASTGRQPRISARGAGRVYPARPSGSTPPAAQMP